MSVCQMWLNSSRNTSYCQEQYGLAKSCTKLWVPTYSQIPTRHDHNINQGEKNTSCLYNQEAREIFCPTAHSW